MNKNFYLLVFFAPMIAGMETPSISEYYQCWIRKEPTMSVAADLINALIILNQSSPSDYIAPSLANAHWCIETLSQKDTGYSKLQVARRLNSAFTSKWLTEYLKTCCGFLDATENLQKTVASNDKEFISFLLSTGNLYLQQIHEMQVLSEK